MKNPKRTLILGIMLLLLGVTAIFATKISFNSNNTLAASAESTSYSGGGTFFEKEYIPVESVVLTASDTVITLGQNTVLNVNLTPFYSISTASQPIYEIIGGRNLATIEGNVLTAGQNTGIVTVIATAEGIQSNPLDIEIEKEPEVFIPVTSIELTSSISQVNENSSTNLENVLISTVYPSNATIQFVTFALTAESKGYADIIGSRLIVNDNLPAGNLSVKVFARSGTAISQPVTISLYVKAKNISFTADSYSPMSTTTFGESISLTANVEGISTLNKPTITVISGAHLIQGGAVIDNTLTVRPNLTSVLGLNKAIRLRAEQDGTVKEITLNIYIPVETFSMQVVGNFERGRNFIEPSFNDYVDDTRWNGYCSINGVKVEGAVSPEGKTIFIPSTTPTGTRVTLTYWSLDRLGKVFQTDFFVSALTNHVEEGFLRSSAMNESAFTLNYAYDSKGYEITKAAKQLWAGNFADIEIKYNGQSLSSFGITNYNINILNGGQAKADVLANGFVRITANADVLANGFVRITANADASGKTSFQYRVTIIDGDQTYQLAPQTINIFRQMKGTLTLSETTISTKTKQLEITTSGTTWDSNATYGIADLEWGIDSRNGVAFTNKGYIEITNYGIANEYNSVVFTFSQAYNATYIEYKSIDYFSPIEIWLKYVLDNKTPKGRYVDFRIWDEQKVTDSDTYTYTNPDGSKIHLSYLESPQAMNLDITSLIKLGYTKITFNIYMYIKEVNDGYQEVALLAGDTVIWSNSGIEHGPGYVDKDWGLYVFSCTIDLNSTLLNNGTYIRLGYGAWGNGDDTWITDYASVSISVW